MKLLIIMASNPYSADFNTMIKFAKAGIKRNDKVSIFFMANGTYCLNHDKVKELADDGVKLYYCAHNAEERKINPPSFAESSSMYGLSKLIGEADKVINLS